MATAKPVDPPPPPDDPLPDEEREQGNVPEPTPEPKAQRSAMDDPAHPLHHLRDA